MAIHGNFASYTIEAAGRTIIRAKGNHADNRLELAFPAGGSLGGGVGSVQVSYETAPAVGTDAHWMTVDGLESLADADIIGKVLAPIEVEAPTVCFRVVGGTPSLTVVVG